MVKIALKKLKMYNASKIIFINFAAKILLLYKCVDRSAFTQAQRVDNLS
jgi:hypothetical protein